MSSCVFLACFSSTYSPIYEVEWWSESSLAVMDKRGHIHILALKMDDEGRPVFKSLLSKALGIQRGQSLASSKDGDMIEPLADFAPLSLMQKQHPWRVLEMMIGC